VFAGRLSGRPPACTAAGWRTARAFAERREEARPALRRYYAALSQWRRAGTRRSEGGGRGRLGRQPAVEYEPVPVLDRPIAATVLPQFSLHLGDIFPGERHPDVVERIVNVGAGGRLEGADGVHVFSFPASGRPQPAFSNLAGNARPSSAFESGMRKGVESARVKRARASPPSSAKPRQRSAAERFPAKELAQAARPDPLPDFVEPCLATLAEEAPAGDAWLHEIKWDGYRLGARVQNGRVTLLTRRGLDWTQRFPPIAEALARLPASTAYLDGEAIVENRVGIADFGALQQALAAGAARNAMLFAFDLLHLDGRDLRREPLIKRKRMLEALLQGQPHHFPIRYSEHLLTDGPAMYRQARAMGLEGIVSKRRDCPYRSGRGEDWLKVKSAYRQEFVIAGYAPHANSSRAVGSIILAEYRDGKLTHVGRAGTGYTARTARELWQRLHPLEIEKAPFPGGRPSGYVARNLARWVEPQLVCEIEFRAWTSDRQLRHASFKGLREDKTAEEVVAEDTASPARQEPPQRGAKAVAPPSPPKVAKVPRKGALGGPAENIQRLLPDAVAPPWEALEAYWRRIAKRALPHLARRPLTLVRHVNGITFFHAGPLPPAPTGVHELRIRKSGGEEGTRLWVDSVEGLLGLVQIGVVELHPWGATVDDIEWPDTLVFDLDPGEGVEWEFVTQTALRLRDLLRGEGLEPWPKTTGGKGLHVMVPFDRAADWSEAKAYSRGIAERLAATDPARYTSSAALAKRSGRLFLDYLRNGRGTTAIGAYSPRARPGFPIAAPVTWRDVESGIQPDTFSIHEPPTTPRRKVA
jgi:bifunctional non-homologous end joining protein LigD